MFTCLTTDDETRAILITKVTKGDLIKNEISTFNAKEILVHCELTGLKLVIIKEVIKLPTAIMHRKYYKWEVFKDDVLQGEFEMCGNIYPRSDMSPKGREFMIFKNRVKHI